MRQSTCPRIGASSKAIGRIANDVAISPEEAKAGMIRIGTPDIPAGAVLQFHGLVAAGHATDVTDLVERIDGKPARGFDELAGDYADAFKSGA